MAKNNINATAGTDEDGNAYYISTWTQLGDNSTSLQTLLEVRGDSFVAQVLENGDPVETQHHRLLAAADLYTLEAIGDGMGNAARIYWVPAITEQQAALDFWRSGKAKLIQYSKQQPVQTELRTAQDRAWDVAIVQQSESVFKFLGI